MCIHSKSVNFARMLYSIADILNSRPREEIEAALDYFNELPRKRGSKQNLVQLLAAYLSAPEVWLDKLMEQDLRMLQRICNAGPGNEVELIPSDYPLVVEVLHFVTRTESDVEGYVRLSIPEPFYDLIAGHINEVIARKELDGSFKLERIILGVVNIYGIVPLRTFVDCVFSEVDGLEQIHELARSMAGHPALMLYQEEYKGETYLVSPFVENYEELLRVRRVSYKQVRHYLRHTPEEAERCGEHSPFCWAGAGSAEGHALLDVLSAIGYEGEALHAAAHTVWLNSQFEPDRKNMEMLLSVVTQVSDELESFGQFSEYVRVIIEYANSVPKWNLKGHSAKGSGLMAYEVTEDQLEALYGPVMSEKESEELMRFFEKVGKVHPVTPDEPCPCGSGLSYRFCHGRYCS